MRTSATYAALLPAAFFAVLVAGCTTHVDVWPPGTHPASPHAATSAAITPPSTLAHSQPVAAADGGVSIQSGISGHDHGSHEPGGDAPVYVCPMHPEVKSAAPGECPKCGMDLELKKAGSDR